MLECSLQNQGKCPIAHCKKPYAQIVRYDIHPRHYSVPLTVEVNLCIFFVCICRAIYEFILGKFDKIPLEPALGWPRDTRDHQKDRDDQHEIDLDCPDHPKTSEEVNYKEDALSDCAFHEDYVVSFLIAYHCKFKVLITTLKKF